jgi:hypothetical protein
VTHPKLRLHRTALDNLVSNLRGEVGEIVTSWVLCKWLRRQEYALHTDDLQGDMSNPDLNLLGILVSRLHDDMVARLAELAEPKIGRLNFHFAAAKLNTLQNEVAAFQTFIVRQGFRDKRNQDISHKELPETWDDHKHRFIRYPTVTRAIAMALRLMKRIDRVVLGPAAAYSWRKGRAKRYDLMNPPRAAYLMMPHIRLTEAERLQVVVQEAAEGRPVWTKLETVVNGQPAVIVASREWGVLHLGDRLLALPDYPIQSLTSLDVRPSMDTPEGDA